MKEIFNVKVILENKNNCNGCPLYTCEVFQGNEEGTTSLRVFTCHIYHSEIGRAYLGENPELTRLLSCKEHYFPVEPLS